MTDAEITALVEHISHLEARIQELEEENAYLKAVEVAREARLQDRIARIIEAQQRSRAAGAKILGD